MFGVDFADWPLETARKDARPRLAALGIYGIGDEPNAVALSGSSDAAAVTTAVATAVWRYGPDLGPRR